MDVRFVHKNENIHEKSFLLTYVEDLSNIDDLEGERTALATCTFLRRTEKDTSLHLFGADVFRQRTLAVDYGQVTTVDESRKARYQYIHDRRNL